MMRWSSLALRIWKRKHSAVNSSHSSPKSKVQASPPTCSSTSERKRLKSDRYKKVGRSCVSVWNRSPSLCRSGCRSKWPGTMWSSLSIDKFSMTTSLRWLSKSWSTSLPIMSLLRTSTSPITTSGSTDWKKSRWRWASASHLTSYRALLRRSS